MNIIPLYEQKIREHKRNILVGLREVLKEGPAGVALYSNGQVEVFHFTKVYERGYENTPAAILTLDLCLPNLTPEEHYKNILLHAQAIDAMTANLNETVAKKLNLA